MTSLLRRAAAGGGTSRRASLSLCCNLIRTLCSSSSPCFDHSPLVPHQPHLHHIPQSLSASSIGLRFFSRSSSNTTDEHYTCDSVPDIKTQEIPQAEEPLRRFVSALDGLADVRLDAMTEDESVDSIAAEEIVDDEPVDSDDLAARGGTESDPDSEVWWAEETEDDEEGNAYPVPKGEDTHTSSSKDFGNSIHATDISTLPDGMEGMVWVDDAFESESAEHDCAVQGNMHLLTLEEVKEVLQNVRARDIQFFPVHERCDWTDHMVLATGISDRHVRGIADALVYKIKKKPYIDPTLYPTIEGREGGKWLVVDCGNIVIHTLSEEARVYYKLEQLWSGDMRFGTADQDLEKMLKTVGLKERSR